MSETAAITTVPVTSPGPAPRAAAARPLSDEVDLYAEANAFSEADWAGPEITDLFGKDGFNFKDLIDVINPLHHLPVVGTVYRALTGDELAPAPRVIGGTLFGGIAGFVTALANTVLENETGRDAGDTVLALFTDDAPAPANLAAATPPAPDPAAKADALPEPVNVSKTTARATTTQLPPGGIDLREVLNPNGAAEAENPAAALIQARAAVPQSPRGTAAAIPNGGLQSGITLPGGKSLPIQFRSGHATAVSPAAVPARTPEPIAAATVQPPPANAPKVTTTDATAGKPRSLQPATPASAAPRETLAAVTPTTGADQEIASKMLDALEKYETLMRSRTAPSISSEI